MAMIGKLFDHITYYYEERDDATAGKLRRLHDWCNVTKGGISGWMPRPQRFVDNSKAAGDGITADNMVDVTWDSLELWNPAFGTDQDSSPDKEIHRFNEMPFNYSRTKS